MGNTGTRRGFFSWTRNALAAAGALRATPGLAAEAAAGEDYYAKLGVTKIINAAGTYTALTASIMPPSVQAAVARCRHIIPCGWRSCSRRRANISPGACNARRRWSVRGRPRR